MITIWKFHLSPGKKPGEPVEVQIPGKAKILDVQWQRSGMVMWFLVNTNTNVDMVKRRFVSFPTGGHVDLHPSVLRFVGTVQQPDGIVVHVFEVFDVASFESANWEDQLSL